MSSIDIEIKSIIGFLTKSQPEVFHSGDTSFELRVEDPRELILMASRIKDSFFLQRLEDGSFDELHLTFQLGLASKWVADLKNGSPSLFEGKKYVRFINYWIPMRGYEGKGAEYRMAKRLQDQYSSLYNELRSSGRELTEVLFVPYYWYSDGVGNQFSEDIYHYLVGRVFRDMGYLVLDSYTPSIVTGRELTPDLSAFKSSKINEALEQLREKGFISSGAFLEELQMVDIFGRVKQTPSQSLTEAENIVVEIKRSSKQYIVTKGSDQLRSYMTEAYGFYDEGYLGGPFIEGKGIVSFSENGDIMFSRADSITKKPLSENWRRLREIQMHDVEAQMKLELLKNLGLPRVSELCKQSGNQTYEQLINACVNLEFDQIISAL